MPKRSQTDIASFAKLDKSGKLLLSTTAMVEVMGITRQGMAAWVKDGCPKSAMGWYPVADVLRWRGLVGGQGIVRTESDLGNMAFKERKMKADAKMRELQTVIQAYKVSELKGELVKTDEVQKELAELFSSLKQSLVHIGHRIATVLNSTHPEVAYECKQVVDDEIAKSLEKLAREGSCIPRKR